MENSFFNIFLSVGAFFVSVLALLVSSVVAWLTLGKKGTVRMTRPSIIYFGYDREDNVTRPFAPKIFMRTLIFATAEKGRVIESLYVTLTSESVAYSFSYWGYGHRNDLVRGSGLFVGKNGVEANHHFNPTEEPENFKLAEGEWNLEVFAHLLDDSKDLSLHKTTLTINQDEADELTNRLAGIHFDWEASENKYISRIVKKPLYLTT